MRRPVDLRYGRLTDYRVHAKHMVHQLDMVATLERFRKELEGGVESTRRTLVLSILERWQDDQQGAGFAVQWRRVTARESLEVALGSGTWDVVICDSRTIRLDLPEMLSLVHRSAPHVPVLLVSGYHCEDGVGASAADECSGILDKDRLMDLPALVRGLIGTSSHY